MLTTAMVLGGRHNVGHCKKIVLAVPVMPADRVTSFASMVDELVFVQAPQDFHAVGQVPSSSTWPTLNI